MAELSVSPATLEIAAKAGSTASFNITSNTNWTVASNQSWLTVDPVSGAGNSTVMATAEANRTAGSRTATIIITPAGAASQTITATQSIDTEAGYLSKDAISVYPNPVKDKFRITGFNGKADISLFDTEGELYLQMKVNAGDYISTGHLSNGIYFLKINFQNSGEIIKLIINQTVNQ